MGSRHVEFVMGGGFSTREVTKILKVFMGLRLYARIRLSFSVFRMHVLVAHAYG